MTVDEDEQAAGAGRGAQGGDDRLAVPRQSEPGSQRFGGQRPDLDELVGRQLEDDQEQEPDEGAPGVSSSSGGAVMPDVWTRHPDIVRDLLKEAGFTCGVPGRFLKGRDPAWTCIYDGKTMKGDLYIHHADTLRSDLREPDDRFAASLAPPGDEGLTAAAIALLLGLLIGLAVRRRAPSA